jgi:hypothetical protein
MARAPRQRLEPARRTMNAIKEIADRSALFVPISTIDACANAHFDRHARVQVGISSAMRQTLVRLTVTRAPKRARANTAELNA